ncbi:hypothetical protein C2845_PM06G34840 [Panicum miliaceum]|uniref:Thaumatin-like protein n=1 Tax=Panicum miliaceum TaxID=4540 RepID=A0A3L6R4Y6_PANMI|nr:hypothetical protein C2845_PM06G34840 [Panicum miliaceum]
MGPPVAGSKPAIFLLLVLVVVAPTAGGASAATFRVTNMCPFPVWPAAIPSGGGTLLQPDQTWVFTVPAGTKAGRIWGRTGCRFVGDYGQCVTGDCAGALRCKLSGSTPATLAEFTLGGGVSGAADFYDVSVVDGFNLPMDFFCEKDGEAPIRCRDPGCGDGNRRPGEGKVRTCNANSDYIVVFCPN